MRGAVLISAVLVSAGSGLIVARELPQIITTVTTDKQFTVLGWRIMPVGDQNGDGYDDVLIGEIGDGVGRTWLYQGGNPPGSGPYVLFDSVMTQYGDIGDFNGDGYDDVVMPSWIRHGWKLDLFELGPTVDDVRDYWFGADTLYPSGYTIRGNDIDRDGIDELVTRGMDYRSLLLFKLAPELDSLPDKRMVPPNVPAGWDYNFGSRIIAGDFNGDGVRDLACNLRFNQGDSVPGEVLVYFGGAAFDTLPDVVIARPLPRVDGQMYFGQVLENLGDINADGYEDFFAGSVSGYDSLGFIYSGGPAFDSVADLVVYDSFRSARWAGDVNHDGYTDFLTSEGTEYSSWGWVNIYFGGPQVDNVPDAVIDVKEVPDVQHYFGREATGVGDINGDGIDDIAVSAVNVYSYGQVYFFAGWQDPVAVDEDEGNLPEKIELHQNYPNPFNPSTTMRFTIPTRSHVKLIVQNVLGQEVRRLIDREVSAGEHEVEWDGTDESGREVASGVYVYRLITEQGEQARKMVLVR